jgi:hypothetical protein
METIVRELKLFFESEELVEVEISNQMTGEVRRSVRGKQSGAFRDAGSFQWTSAVRGLALLVVRTAARFEKPAIEGEAKSLTASLDYAISKQPLWLTEMFGCDRMGTCLVRRMVLRTNPERKRPGPTVLAINERYMPVEAISIFNDGVRCVREDLIVLAVGLACAWSSSATRAEAAKAA